MAGIVFDSLEFSNFGSSEPKVPDFGSDREKALKTANDQAKRIFQAFKAIDQVTNTNGGLLTRWNGTYTSDDKDGTRIPKEISEVLLQDYLAHKEYKINIGLRPGLIVGNHVTAIEVNPENIEKLIKSLNKAAAKGKELKEVLSNENGGRLSDPAKAEVELVIRHTITNSLHAGKVESKDVPCR